MTQQKEPLIQEGVSKKRMYVTPVKDWCNANCTFCYMHERKRNKTRPQFIEVESLDTLVDSFQDKISEVEITGGGDPSLHPHISEVVEIFTKRNIYTKMYTNGFFLPEIPSIDEINISRVHWDSQINNSFYRSRNQNDLEYALQYYRPLAKKIRMQTILLKGAIDSAEKIREFVAKYDSLVDVFMFRTLFPGCSLEKDKFVAYPEINNPKVKFDSTLDDYSRPLFFVNTDCVLQEKFDYG
ncbi:radical SAM protein [Candidatus Pacearchaeota archaeon]|nr:radical SAM protein [Candidatus Pacearchaeota archaeon]